MSTTDLGMPALPSQPPAVPGFAPSPGFTAEVRARLERDAKEVIARYPQPRSALLPLLHLVQAEEGFVSGAGIEFCADLLELTTADVTGVATFYTMYRRRPGGRYQVGVCTNTLCAVMGGDAILAALKDHLGVDNDGTTEDGTLTLEHIECNAACDYAPVMMVNWEFFDNVTPETARGVVDDLRAGRTVTPSRGAPLCTFQETSRQLAGFPDTRPGALEAGGAGGDPSLVGLRLARGGPGSTAPPGNTASSGTTSGTARPGTPSSHDAPTRTAPSDPAHPAGPVTGPSDDPTRGSEQGGEQ